MSGNLALHGALAKLVARQAELPVIAVRPPGNRAAVAFARGARITRNRVEPRLRSTLFFIRALHVTDDRFQLRALLGVLRDELLALEAEENAPALAFALTREAPAELSGTAELSGNSISK